MRPIFIVAIVIAIVAIFNFICGSIYSYNNLMDSSSERDYEFGYKCGILHNLVCNGILLSALSIILAIFGAAIIDI